ncbi:enoyl-CoA delta isomerase 1, mitochondrial-like [Lucilia sericata]|uniref:enoyl-CoA delta isomerase 1, mitochondrial-like n=1 Tax=Lucilia sericata TaxID=13632 RepID=UPI0018A83F70|nr:enoyl-CoA delta isomerase 1, mitochondrial-like [Lucilia sericata]XP_037825594.1 enoyl-CoA delta isomerase 1, mitochondrial-like [Lucilia sericata]
MWYFKKINTKALRPALRSLSSIKENFVNTEIDNKTGIAIVKLHRKPVNALNLQLLQELKKTIKNVEEQKCQGLILTSNINGIFSSGLDLKELYKPQLERLEQVYAALRDAALTLYSSPLTTAVLINGHSPAGGCVLGICCDYRVMLSNFSIGLNETQVGVAPPSFVEALFCNIVSRRTAELALIQGKMFSTTEAFDVGLVDAIADSKEEGLHKCEKFITSLRDVNQHARILTKLQFRKSVLEVFERERVAKKSEFVSRVMEADFQQQLDKYLESLKNKRKIE